MLSKYILISFRNFMLWDSFLSFCVHKHSKNGEEEIADLSKISDITKKEFNDLVLACRGILLDSKKTGIRVYFIVKGNMPYV